MGVNLTKRHDDGGWARYLPAISGFYTTHLGKALADPNFVPQSRIPEKFEFGLQGLNFLDPDNSYFSYGYGLFSAGHAERNLAKCDGKEPMIHKRDRSKTVIIGDSGGFQIATGVIKLDWATVMTPAGDKLRNEILRYLEHTADWSMTLDVPAFACEPGFREKTGLTSFDDCLKVTEYNLNHFIKNRVPGKTKFLNVLSGSKPENSKIWYDRVKKFSIPMEVADMGLERERTFEGFAFAGVNMRNMIALLSRMLDLRRDGLLEGKDWIHFLGIGRLDWACYLTSIERVLKQYNPNINISFDAASPFVAAGGYALSYTYNHFNPDRLTYSMGSGVDHKGLKGSKLALPYQGPIMERLTAGDLCVMGPTDVNGHGKIGKTSWDTTTYALVMAHNVYNHIQAVQEINRLADIEYATQDQELMRYQNWWQNKKKPISDHIPNSILYFNNFVQVLFTKNDTDARNMISEAADFLTTLGFGDKVVETTHSSLFDMASVDEKVKPTAESLAASDNMGKVETLDE